MSEYKPGTKIHVEFDAIVEKPNEYDYIKSSSGGLHANSDYGYGFLKIRDTKNSLYHYVWAGPDDESTFGSGLVSVIAAPPDWEKHNGPQVGDIWEANGREYFAYSSLWSTNVILYPVDGSGIGYSVDNYDEFAAKNPRLLRRRGETV